MTFEDFSNEFFLRTGIRNPEEGTSGVSVTKRRRRPTVSDLRYESFMWASCSESFTEERDNHTFEVNGRAVCVAWLTADGGAIDWVNWAQDFVYETDVTHKGINRFAGRWDGVLPWDRPDCPRCIHCNAALGTFEFNSTHACRLGPIPT